MLDTPERIQSEIQPSLANLLVRLWEHLTKKRQWQLGALLVLMLVSAFSEIISLGSVLPFIGILTNPEKVFNNEFGKKFSDMVGITSAKELALAISIAFATAAVIVGALRLLMLWLNTRVANAIGSDLSLEIFKRTLYQPYKIHVARNSSQVIDGISTKSWSVVAVVQEMLMFISSIILLLALLVTLLFVDPVIVLVASVVCGIGYGLVGWIARYRLKINSERVAKESVQVVKTLQEAIGGIRDVLLNGAQSIYCEVYRKADLPYRKANGNNLFIATSPRFAMEAIGMVLVTVLAYIMSSQSGGLSNSLPILGVLVLGAKRLLPTAQQIYASWAAILGNEVSLAYVISFLDQPLPDKAFEPPAEPLNFEDAAVLKSVRFKYLDEGPWVLNDLNLIIPKGSRIGVVGTTGSGKSTAMDLLMGLLEPTEGEILVDGEPIKGERLRRWQRTIAHVPQSIFLADTTIAENIAFGLTVDLIDMDRVRNAAKGAQIDKFIEGKPQGYKSLIGERGIQLSGGQRQRLGIARALYKEASILVFDEATSSLDNATEKAVMESIENLSPDLTIIIIAHRLTTIKRCDEIIELENGKVVARGSYKQLLKISPSFKTMANAVI